MGASLRPSANHIKTIRGEFGKNAGLDKRVYLFYSFEYYKLLNIMEDAS